jgi:predicted amidophosphoribosyltransferase
MASCSRCHIDLVQLESGLYACRQCRQAYDEHGVRLGYEIERWGYTMVARSTEDRTASHKEEI